ncbi:hypothetical protein Pcac1_g15563 [Phytophthora cactorum]|uniref:Uncharacterized protein n=1 Tax=Phytophthora cactorum TaxID=29920 RepID=A0A8T0XW73_9STRA|nr:hypothetical protein Pcac1_g15554 [Phytophthora cactorum]KAG2773797.1 hypothetical protein Pcac1_g15563 [Phytophthora cactorum]KAG2794908.1 hypothetical protein PC111_g22378 [Phytophthora cactorum]KAG2816115.1 hypothetical protein PC113_g23129 [Phytophthora cactorum]KAG2873270.1 hypothetical protein PC114_g25946 [Phytophthora cactorum]
MVKILEAFPPSARRLNTTTSTTESTLSVDEYHALQYKKRVEDKAAAPETILEGSSVFHTDGSMPTDYGPDISDVPMEDGEVPSSAADSESAAVAHEPVTGSRRPREDDPSASSSKRSRNDEEEKAPTPATPSSPRSVPTERAPWMPSASEIASRFGATSPPNPIPLYVCSAIVDDAEAAAQHFDPMTNQRRDYFIGLFHELRWHASKKTSCKAKCPRGWHFVNLGTPLLKTSTKTRKLTAPASLRRNCASRLSRGVI